MHVIVAVDICLIQRKDEELLILRIRNWDWEVAQTFPAVGFLVACRRVCVFVEVVEAADQTELVEQGD